MTEFFFEIGVFTGKMLIFVVLAGALFAVAGSAITEHKKWKKKKRLEVEDLGENLKDHKFKVQSFTHSEKTVKKQIKADKKEQKSKKKQEEQQARAYVLDFEGDMEASQVELLREEISVLLQTADPKKDEIIVRLNNRGGLVHSHGLGASQLERLRKKGFFLTVCVDEVAGSGGYLMACVANKILSAPFAGIGSIGVLTQIPNFYRFLQKQNVDYEEHHAGEYKRTVTMFGKTTDEQREKLKAQLAEIHSHFKNYIVKYRPKVDLSQIATGEHWLGLKAKELGLVDDIQVSDDYILSLLESKKVYQIKLKEEEPTGLQSLLSKKVKLMTINRLFLLIKKLFASPSKK